MKRLFLAFALSTLGCVDSGIPVSSDGGGGGGSCHGLAQAACAKNASCRPFIPCPSCGGGGTFLTCLDKTESNPVGLWNCPLQPVTCALSCNDYQDDSCRLDARCVEDTCPTCNGGATFAGCHDKSAGSTTTVACGLFCPEVCATLDQTSCTTNPQCVAVDRPDCNGGSTYCGCFDRSQLTPGMCAPPPCPPPVCLALGAACTSDAQCCGALCVHFNGPGGHCAAPSSSVDGGL